MKKLKRLSPLYQHLMTELRSIYDEQEASSICFLLLEKRLDVTKGMVVANELFDNTNALLLLERDLQRLADNEPVQYVLGEADFYGHQFFVNAATLIPRPETEELVNFILNNHDNSKLKVLDVGTGSGCIPISLKKERANWDMQALDISKEALNVATKNAQRLEVSIDFHLCDVINEELPSGAYDIIVSNPPYVLESERAYMSANVLRYEPERALFVPDTDPLRFYKRIARLAMVGLTNSGSLYFEINERFGEQLMRHLEELGFQKVSLIKDLHGKNRIVNAVFNVAEV